VSAGNALGLGGCDKALIAAWFGNGNGKVESGSATVREASALQPPEVKTTLVQAPVQLNGNGHTAVPYDLTSWKLKAYDYAGQIIAAAGKEGPLEVFKPETLVDSLSRDLIKACGELHPRVTVQLTRHADRLNRHGAVRAPSFV